MTEAECNEKLNEEEYEQMMADSAAKRAADSKSLAQREGAKADNLSNVEESLTDEIKALAAGIVALDKSVAEATEQRKEQTKEGQNDIYYITLRALKLVSSSPFFVILLMSMSSSSSRSSMA